MTIEAVHAPVATRKPFAATWVPVATDLWAGSTEGNFIGLIEKVGQRGYTARDGRSVNLGLFTSLSDAKRAVERSQR